MRRLAWPFLFALSFTRPAGAALPAAERLDAGPPQQAFEASGGSIEAAQVGGERVLRWRLDAGRTSVLSLRKEHPLFSRLRYFDRFHMEFRIASGEVNELGLDALGHVSGPRQYKVHQWTLGLRTTAPGVWHTRHLDLARPGWFVWDNPDGEDPDGFFRLDALALVPGTVIELRNLRLIRGLIFLKPDYELPVTWPVKSANADGSVTYTAAFEVLNATGRPTEIAAAVLSSHKRFKTAVEPARAAVKAAQKAQFTLTATISRADIAAAEELYSEPLHLSFAPAEAPDAACLWEGSLVRPLSPGGRRQVVVAADDLAKIRQALNAGDAEMRKAVGLDRILKAADELLGKRLEQIPGGNAHPSNNWPGAWRPGDFMPEAVIPATGEREAGTQRAGQVWKEYLGQSGDACENLGMAYLLTGDEKYARKAVELFGLYGRQYTELPWRDMFDPPWNSGPNILASSRTAGNCTYGSNWLFKGHCRLLSMVAESPSWTDAQREEVYRGFVLPYATELLKYPGGISNMTDITNHNLLLLGIVCDDAILVRQALLRDPGLLSRLSDIDADGFSSEGRPLNYHFAEMAEYVPSLAYLENSRLPIRYPKERILEALRMPYLRAALTGRVPSTGDCGRGMGVGSNGLADNILALFPKEEWLFGVGTGRTLESRVRAALAGRKPDPQGWRKLLDPNPRLFREAGMAILRSGTTPETQVMATLDYGRNLFHAALDRNQITLCAFGRVFSHGPGSTYNVGSGGMTRTQDKRLDSFCSHHSIGQNVVLVDGRDQLPCVGRLLGWSPGPERQVAVSRVDGIRPGVSHTRALVLEKGVVVVLDRLESAEEHAYDFAYHNLGKLAPGEGWSAGPASQPLGSEDNYGNIVDLQRLAGAGPVRLTWDLSGEVSQRRGEAAEPGPAVKLALWQLPVPGAQAYVGKTGMNNPNTLTIPDAAPSLFLRTRGKTAFFATVLEPYAESPRVRGIAPAGADGVSATLADGSKITVGLGALIQKHAAGPGADSGAAAR